MTEQQPTTQAIDLDYEPRPWQQRFHDGSRGKPRALLVTSRQIGKTWSSIAELVHRTLASPAHSNSAYICPYASQARKIAWPRLKQHLQPLIDAGHCQVKETESSITLPGGRIIYVLGAESGDALRGLSLRNILIDELDSVSEVILNEVILPTTSAHGEDAWIGYIGTLSGARSKLWQLYLAHKDDDDWCCMVVPAPEAGVFSERWMASRAQEIGVNAWAREYMCDPSAAVENAVLGTLMQDAHDEGRIKDSLPLRMDLPLIFGFDLGIRDFTAVWVCQLSGHWVSLVAYHEYSGIGLGEVVNRLMQKYRRFNIDSTVLPHDIKNRELVTGQSRLELFQGDTWPGFPEVLSPPPAIADTLHSTRLNLPRCVFSVAGADVGIQRLKAAAYVVDTKTGTVHDKIKHDDNSHCLDGFRYLLHWIEREYPTRQGPGNGAEYAPAFDRTHGVTKVIGNYGTNAPGKMW